MIRKTDLIERAIKSNGNFGMYCFMNKNILRQGLKQFRESFNLYKQEIEEEEMAQEILMVATICYKLNKEEGFLMTSIENKRIDCIKYFSAKKRKSESLKFEKMEDNMYNNIEDRIFSQELLTKLSKYERGILIAKAIYGYNYKEIAPYVGKTRQTVSKDYKKIQAKLRNELSVKKEVIKPNVKIEPVVKKEVIKPKVKTVAPIPISTEIWEDATPITDKINNEHIVKKEDSVLNTMDNFLAKQEKDRKEEKRRKLILANRPKTIARL